MLEVLAGKAVALGLPLRTRLLDPAATDLGGPYDLILSSMTLHHVQDVPALFRAFAAHLQPGGAVALADLDEEPGTFHDGHGDVFHLGFKREAIREWLEAAGFMAVGVETAAVTRKADREYPIFLATARLRNPST
jgi:2-polyprenyl-3-methyl-5-hydroxy-6-metoxy-1,4-benzoquinol methylase